ncbi:hypothetical protein [Actinocorallia populi]|uniref:hypothetical protein n=1 Tax=Actinocorallia populi TaxID=2079200 RepID=UPI000D08AD51|nr:hypothetical protein [Actinocorallia populi]
MTVVTLGAGVGLTAVPASAAPKKVTKKWSTFAGMKELKAVHAGGRYTRSGKKIVIRGRITDKARNGWTPGVQFLVYNNGKWTATDPIGIFREPGRTPIDGQATVPSWNKPEGKFKTLRGTHLKVRELAISTKKKQPIVGAWKKVF